ncbi:MAG TPA: glycosyltransferase [Solirubrobacteraceae bacterium]|nr:glycosyltransferase [Solirubrobacteraceae bacterium]
MSIVIPTLDVTSAEVQECLCHVKATVRVPHEVIVIDNGTPPQGFTAPVNAGLRAARGQYLVVLNDDVEVLDGWWEPLSRALEAGSEVVFPMTVDGEMIEFPAWCFAMRRDMLERFAVEPDEFLDPSLTIWASDVDLYVRLKAAGTPPLCVSESRIRHHNHRTVDLEHPDERFRNWLHAQLASDRAAFRLKYPLSPGGPSTVISPDQLPPIPLAVGPIVLQAPGPGWHGQTLRWPEGIGHFLLAGEAALSGSAEEIAVQFVFTDEQDSPLFYFNLVPGAVKTRFGYFLLERERAGAVPQHAGGQRDPAWSAIRKVIVRCSSGDPATSVIVTNLRAFARIEDGTIVYGNVPVA